jgi:signal transduction histidine kinase
MKLRGKLLLVSLSLLVLPWAGWQFLRLVGDVVREGQEEALLASASALARGLEQRAAMLPPDGPTIHAERLIRAPTLDGHDDDWQSGDSDRKQVGDERAGFAARLGLHDEQFHLLIAVTDATVQRTDAHWPIAARRDHVLLVLQGRQGIVALRLANRASGALIVTGEDGSAAPMSLVGEWLETPDGYTIELSLPQGYALRALAVTVVDADAEDRVHRMDSTEANAGRAWAVVTYSQALANSLAQLLPTGMSARVLDRAGRPLAEAGELTGLDLAGEVPFWRRWFYNALLFDRLRATPGEPNRETAAMPTWRRDDGSQRLVLSATVPLVVAGETRAELFLERESDAVLRLTDRAFSGLFGMTLLALLIAIAALLLFSSRLGARIRRLRDAAENALDRDGRVRRFRVATAGDEIGDLSRSFGRLLDEIAIYTGYLRGLAGKLSHEINTPIAIVRTSLENLEADPGRADAQVYIERARVGIDRLGALVRAMSEAGRIEQAIESAEIEAFDLHRLLDECGEGYRALLEPRSLDLALSDAPYPFRGAPDLIVQALDKLIDNARDFCPPEGRIRIGLSGASGMARITVANSGPLLPEAMRDKLFDSLVSVRERKAAGDGVHLGFGLHIVKLVADLHHGVVEARNLSDGSGVEFALHLRPISER